MAESGMSPDSIPKDRLHDPETRQCYDLVDALPIHPIVSCIFITTEDIVENS